MRVLVTGAGGLLGRTCLALARAEHDPIGLTRSELDVTDRKRVARTLSQLRPEVVLHCAAYTDVDGAEREEARAMEVNAVAAGAVARAAAEAGAMMVYISTDYVFDGEKGAPYREEDRPRPLSRYGISKLEGERRVAQASPDSHLIVRSAWLYGQGKGFVDRARRQLEEGRPISFVADQVGSPTWAAELARALMLLAGLGLRGLFHFVNKGETSWLDLARAVVRLTGRAGAVLEPARLADLGRPAPRPRYSALAVDKFERATGTAVAAWQEALGSYLASTGPLRRNPPA